MVDQFNIQKIIILKLVPICEYADTNKKYTFIKG